MEERNPVLVCVYGLITCGIYHLVWSVKTKNEMNTKGAEIPTAWLLIIPIVNIFWVWKYSQGVEHVTDGDQSSVLVFILLFLLGPIGAAIVQSFFNSVE